MAKISVVKRFILEDFPREFRPVMTKLIQPLNQFLEQSIAALQNGLTLADNLKSKRYDLTIQASQTYPIKLAYNLNERPTDCRVAYLVEDSGDPSPPVTAYSCYWVYDAGSLSITLIGLDAAKRYKVTIIAQV